MVGFITDLTVFNVLFHEGELKAKVVATAAATTVTYFGNRYFVLAPSPFEPGA